MTTESRRIRVAVNGYGVIGKRVADAVVRQPDMQLLGIADLDTSWRLRTAQAKGYPLFAAVDERVAAMREAGFDIAGALDDLLQDADVIVDCTPKGIAAKNAERYRERGTRFIVQGG